MGVLWPYRSTWRQFRAEESRTLPFEEAGNWNRVFERYCDAQDGSTDVHFPNLASVWFSYSSRRGIDPELATFTSIPQCALELFQPHCVPVLTEVHLHANLALPDPDEHCERLPWSQLHSITLEGVPSAYLCILFYRIAPTIRELNLQMLDTESFPTAPSPSTSTTFPALTKLTVDCVDIVTLMTAPVLNSITFSNFTHESEPHTNPTQAQDTPGVLPDFIPAIWVLLARPRNARYPRRTQR